MDEERKFVRGIDSLALGQALLDVADGLGDDAVLPARRTQRAVADRSSAVPVRPLKPVDEAEIAVHIADNFGTPSPATTRASMAAALRGRTL
jgi:hypothetical protein